ncbi:MAG: hypothetical protein JJV88_05255 [Sulfurovum sp.]|nr:hypothetical protein [Sulfurovaceae bacterium]
MDKQVITVIFSFLLYVVYVLLPMIPALIIYKLFPDTRVSATGTLSGWKVKTTGAFSAYIVTVIIGYFIVQNTHKLIAQMNNPYWKVNAKVELLNEDGTPYKVKYSNNNLIDTLQVVITPRLQRINSGAVHLIIPGDKSDWGSTELKFEIPNYGYASINFGEEAANSIIDNYALSIKLLNPVKIIVDKEVINGYTMDNVLPLEASTSDGPRLYNK